MGTTRSGRVVWAGLTAVCGLAIGGAAAAAPAYLNQPDIHGDRLVFCAEADLWTCATSGAEVRRLTTHPGAEYFPAFAPDGASVAFTGEYDGNRDVYVVPVGGGEPRRLTWHPGADEVIGWWPDGKSVIFRSGRTDPMGDWHLFTVPVTGGDATELPLGWAARLDVEPRTGRWAFNRAERERATWKRYRGGTAADIWVGDPKQADFRQITDFAGADAFPMWHDGGIVFLSDQGGTGNLWRIEADGTGRKRLTDHGDWDVQWPSMGPDGRVVYTVAADIHIYDPATGQSRKVAIDLPSERTLTRMRYPNPGESFTEFALSPDGERVLYVTRGEIYSIAAKKGVTLPISQGSGARERAVTFDPKGEKILFISDASQEDELRVVDAWGRGEAKVVRKFALDAWANQPLWSPDGKWLAWSDSEYRLWIMPADGGEPRQVDRGTENEIGQYAWSPDGRWLAYAKTLPNDYDAIFIHDVAAKVNHQVTSEFSNEHSMAWDPDGRYLYFVSNRATNPILGQVDWDNVEARNEMLYMLLLRDDVENPLQDRAGLPPAKDEKADKAKKDEAKKDDKKDDAKADEAPKPVEIDFDGLADRYVELPVPVGNYAALGATSSHLFFVQNPLKGMAEQPALFEEGGPEAVLMSFSLEDREAKPFVEGMAAYDLQAKAGKIAVMKNRGEIYVLDAASPPGPDMAKQKLDTGAVVLDLDPREEWAQIYHEAWRQMRAFYWDPKMSGLDWNALRDQYATLLPRLASRADLSDLLGQLFGEVNTSHSYVWGGDPGVRVARVSTGMLGCDAVREGDAYKVVKIYRGDAVDRVRSPLAEPGVNVKEGEYILAVNRAAVAGAPSLDALFANLAGKDVLLTVGKTSSAKDTRDVLVTPLPSETDLRYAHWVRENREYVAAQTGGKIGYIHVPDMWTPGLVAFNKWYYPQLDKEGLVVDVRWNGGGAVSQMLLARLQRKLLSFDLRRGGGVGTYPNRVLNGPFVVLTNEFAGSDGDIFPQAVQLAGLAPVIGIRSWGGVVGISGLRPLQDGGAVTNPIVAWWDPRDGWDLENRGVIPDIEVQNLPQDLARGKDAQLDRGIAEVLKLHAEHPPVQAEFGKIRDRSRKAFAGELKP